MQGGNKYDEDDNTGSNANQLAEATPDPPVKKRTTTTKKRSSRRHSTARR